MSSLTKKFDLIRFKELKIPLPSEDQTFNERVCEEIEKSWKENPNCFNGELLHVLEVKVKNGIAFIETQKSNYKNFIGTNNRRPSCLVPNLGTEYCMPLSTGTIIITSDEKIIVTKRNGTHLNSGLWSFPAEGYLTPEHTLGNRISVYHATQEETKEELGFEITQENLKSFEVLGIVFDKKITKQPYIATLTEIKMSSGEVEKEFKKADKKEFQKIFFIENNKKDIENFLETHEVTIHNRGKTSLYLNTEA